MAPACRRGRSRSRSPGDPARIRATADADAAGATRDRICDSSEERRCMRMKTGILLLASMRAAPASALAQEPVLFDWFEYTRQRRRVRAAAATRRLPQSGAGRLPSRPSHHPRRRPLLPGQLHLHLLPGHSRVRERGPGALEADRQRHRSSLAAGLRRPGHVARRVRADHRVPRRHLLRDSTPPSTAAATSSPPPPIRPGPGPIRSGCPTIGGIDPSLFFDDDGKTYLLNNDAAGRHAALRRPPRHLDAGVRPGDRRRRSVRARC